MRPWAAALRELQAEDFALYETALYLDSHPEDREALSYFTEKKEKTEALRKKVARAGYPLAFTDTPEGRYAWVTSPWPWQKGGC